MIRAIFFAAVTGTDPFSTAIVTFFKNLIGIGQGVAVIIAVFFVLLSGFLWATSNGNARQIERAKGSLVAAGVGLFIALLANTIATLITTAIPTGIN